MLHYHNKPIVDSRLRPGLAFLRGGLLSVYALSRCLFLAVMCKHDVIYKTENYITYRNAARATAMGNMHKNLARSGHKFLEIRFCFKLVKKDTNKAIAIIRLPLPCVARVSLSISGSIKSVLFTLSLKP